MLPRGDRMLPLSVQVALALSKRKNSEVLSGPTLDCPLTAFAGAHDPNIAVDDVAGWKRHTTGSFQLVRLDAGHYFVRERNADLVGEIVRALAKEGP